MPAIGRFLLPAVLLLPGCAGSFRSMSGTLVLIYESTYVSSNDELLLAEYPAPACFRSSSF